MNAIQYTEVLKKLLSPGKLWRDLTLFGQDIYLMLLAIAQEFERTDAEIEQLALENLPATSSELLADWEAFVGIPDDCVPVLGTQGERQLNAMTRLVSEDILTEAELIQQAAVLGYDIEVITHLVPVCGPLVCGETIAQSTERFWIIIRVNGVTGGARVGAMVCGDIIGGSDINNLFCFVRRNVLEHYEIQYEIL